MLQYGPRYNWSAYEQSTILGAFFYGYAISSIPFGILVDKYGFAKANVGWGFVIGILMTFGTVFAADTFGLMVALRFLLGLASVCKIFSLMENVSQV